MKLLKYLPWLGLLRAQPGNDVDVNINSAVATSDSAEIDVSAENPAAISSNADATVAEQPDIFVLPVSSTSQLDASEPTQLGVQPASETIGILLARLVQVAEESGNDALVAAGISASMMASTNVYPGSSRDLALQILESLQSSVQLVAATAVAEPLSSLQAAGSTISIAISSVNKMALAVAPTQTSSDSQSSTKVVVGAMQTSSDSQSLTNIANGPTQSSGSASPKTFQSLDMSAVPPAPTSTATGVLSSSTSINDSATTDPTAPSITAESSATTGTVEVSDASSTPTDIGTSTTSDETSTADSTSPTATQGISIPANGTVNTLPAYSPGPDASSALKLSLSLTLCVLAYFVTWI